MTICARRLATALVQALALFLAMPLAACAGEAEWQAHMKTGETAFQRGDYRGAAASFTAALKEAEAFGETDPRFAPTLNNLATLYYTQGQYAQAEPLYKRSLAIREKALGPEHPDVATSLNNLAGLYRATDRIEAAEKLEKRAARILAIKR